MREREKETVGRLVGVSVSVAMEGGRAKTEECFR